MFRRLTVILVWSLLGLAVTAVPAHASESRASVLTATCDGTQQHLQFNATGLGTTNRFIQGAEITAVDTRGSLLYVVVRAQNDDKKWLLMAGPGSPHTRGDFTGFLQVTPDASGNVLIGVDVNCTSGPPLTIAVAIYFFS
jgi:hypothetical protein